MANILIIEDNNDIHELLKDLFQAEHRVYSAYSGTEGLLVFAQQKIDLVLLDIMLPGKNGDQVLAEIRKSSQIPVVMLTALGEKSLVSQYLLNGANDYIVKPFNLDEVFARVTVQLRSHFSRDQIDEIQRVKNIRLLPDTFEVVKGDNRVRLGKKEYQILQTLLCHPKKIYTKEELFELVWEEPYLPGDNTLNTHLSNLRKKLAQLDPTEEYIETIWGLGVRIKED
ncbi:response regulator transcription factor [Streptococcus intermedius]|uniref:Response regulator n=1 Tax=Streptococcus intermedius TaxID=1338 RepID=A0AAD1C6I6_STRIT|nr:response regulator transcription factor [Streptococcus intermedius]EKU16194.1 response regulator [Streptococcus intermedius BA1]EKU18030.1 response regulator [Streptococcus intermedius BA1]MCI3918415.1 response regulator transcription factor [Streptococcus intermedius]MDK8091407.1 response regulator transcription factor [Streptococcus intermedius]PMR63834.1 DNA-binding response regulator [Streptococcus intermedius]